MLEISEEDLAKVKRFRQRLEPRVKVNDTWLFLAEFGYYFGWGGVQAVRNNEISIDEAEMLVRGARKVWSGKVYDFATASFIASASVNSKNPSNAFTSATNSFIKNSKVDV